MLRESSLRCVLPRRKRDMTSVAKGLKRTGFAQKIGERRHAIIALLAFVCIAAYLIAIHVLDVSESPANRILWLALLLGGGPLIAELARRLLRGQWGSDILAAISIIASVLLGEYLAGALVVLMLAGGAALEALAVRRASSA